MAKDFRQIRSQAGDVMRVQDNVRDRFQELNRLPILDGRLTDSISLTSGQINNLEHGLGREPLGWFVVQLDADTNIWQSSLDVRFINLQVGTNCTARFWVF